MPHCRMRPGSIPLCGLLCLTLAGAFAAPFKQPPEAERLAALGDIGGEPEAIRHLLTPDDNFTGITQPGPNDWLTWHIERGQTFADFQRSPGNLPDAKRRTLYLQPLGAFPEDGSPPLEELRRYLEAYFQLPAKLLPAHYPHDLEFAPRKNPHSGQPQILTREITRFLQTRLPDDAYCLIAVTMTDLYPAPSWNFVFGEAALTGRVGVFSFARHDPGFAGGNRPKDYLDLMLRRGCKTLAHETAHMFGLHHCIFYDCAVNGSNHLVEADARPQHLCPVCLRKLHYSARFDPVRRYEELFSFYRRHRWYEEADWVQRQLARKR